MPDLLDLVRLALRSLRLQIQNLRDAGPRKDVIASLDSLLKTELGEQALHAGKKNIVV
jgi:hypothetical protein